MQPGQVKFAHGLEVDQMMRQTKFAWLIAVAAAAAAAGCAAGGAKQDVEFVRGCWAFRFEPDGPVTMMLRLLPEGQDGPTYRGIVREFEDTGDAGTDSYEFIFSRDGRWLEMDNHAPDSVRRLSSLPPPRLVASKPPPETVSQFGPNDHWAGFRFEGGDWVVAGSVGGDKLIIYLVHEDGKLGQTYALGDRDGCD
jgi:hypothetical protein